MRFRAVIVNGKNEERTVEFESIYDARESLRMQVEQKFCDVGERVHMRPSFERNVPRVPNIDRIS